MAAIVTAPAVSRGGLHVGIIMDGNGRWAAARGLPRIEGHRHGATVVRQVVEAAPGLGIATLTLYAFSADNWRRPRAEVMTLMSLFGEYLRGHERHCVNAGVRVALVGRRDRLPSSVRRSAERVERVTAAGTALDLRLAIDYSSRDAIWRAAERFARAGQASREAFAASLATSESGGVAPTDVDLVVRTGGERRLSDFLLWESAYAELWFTDTAWPDFTAADLARALDDFGQRERRFGGLPAVVTREGAAHV